MCPQVDGGWLGIAPDPITAVTNYPCDPNVSVTFSVSATDNCAVASITAASGAGTATHNAPPGGASPFTPSFTFSFPVGTTTVAATATDIHGNSASCSFTVTVFDCRLQDDSPTDQALLWNSKTGEYRYRSFGETCRGTGKIRKIMAGNICSAITLEDLASHWRVMARLTIPPRGSKTPPRGSAELQTSKPSRPPSGRLRPALMDRNTQDDTAIVP